MRSRHIRHDPHASVQLPDPRYMSPCNQVLHARRWMGALGLLFLEVRNGLLRLRLLLSRRCYLLPGKAALFNRRVDRLHSLHMGELPQR